LLKGIAEFPRKALTDRFFLRGSKVDEDALVAAMDVAGDHLIPEFGSRNAMRMAEGELKLIRQLDESSLEAKEKCRALLALIRKGETAEIMSNCVPELEEPVSVQEELLIDC